MHPFSASPLYAWGTYRGFVILYVCSSTHFRLCGLGVVPPDYLKMEMVILSLMVAQNHVVGWGWPRARVCQLFCSRNLTARVQIPAVGCVASHLTPLNTIFLHYQVGLLTPFSIVVL